MIMRALFLLIAILADPVAGVAFTKINPEGIWVYLFGLVLWAPTGAFFYAACRKGGVPITTGYLAFSIGTTLVNWFAGVRFLNQSTTPIELVAVLMGVPALLLAITSTREAQEEP